MPDATSASTVAYLFVYCGLIGALVQGEALPLGVGCDTTASVWVVDPAEAQRAAQREKAKQVHEGTLDELLRQGEEKKK